MSRELEDALRRLDSELRRLGTGNELRALAVGVTEALAAETVEARADRVMRFWSPWWLDRGETVEMAETYWAIKEPARGRLLELMHEAMRLASALSPAEQEKLRRFADPVIGRFRFDGHELEALKVGVLVIDGTWRVDGLERMQLLPPAVAERPVDGVLLVESTGVSLWAVDLGKARYARIATLHPAARTLGHRYLPRATIRDGAVHYVDVVYAPAPQLVLRHTPITTPLDELPWRPGAPA